MRDTGTFLITVGCLLYTWTLVFAGFRAMVKPAQTEGTDRRDGPVMTAMFWGALAIPAVLVFLLTILVALSVTGLLDTLLDHLE